jgi:hypothetical protein
MIALLSESDLIQIRHPTTGREAPVLGCQRKSAAPQDHMEKG